MASRTSTRKRTAAKKKAEIAEKGPSEKFQLAEAAVLDVLMSSPGRTLARGNLDSPESTVGIAALQKELEISDAMIGAIKRAHPEIKTRRGRVTAEGTLNTSEEAPGKSVSIWFIEK